MTIKTPYSAVAEAALRKGRKQDASDVYNVGKHNGYAEGYADAEAQYKALAEALEEVLEHFCTPSNDRTASSYGRTNQTVVASARSALAALKEA